MNLKQFAQQLHLSPTTVSRALGGYSDVSEQTRQRVLKAAKELGYQPNQAAQQLRAGKADALGLVLPVAPEQFASPLFSEIIAGLGEELAHDHQALLVTACPPGPEEIPHYERLIKSRRVDGFVVLRTRQFDERAALLQAAGIPFVMHGRSESAPQAAYVDIDAEEGFYQATKHLIALGHHQIALINAPADLYSAIVRRKGYERALTEAGIVPQEDVIRTGHLDEHSGHELALSLLKQEVPPTAIMCVNDQTAFGVMHAARELGLQIGSDVSIIGYDDIPSARYTEPPLTTLSTATRQTGRRLAQIHRALLQGTPPSELQELWLPVLIPRRTHGAPALPNAARTDAPTSKKAKQALIPSTGGRK